MEAAVSWQGFRHPDEFAPRWRKLGWQRESDTMRAKALQRAAQNESAAGTAPKVATVGGVTVVTIPLADYEDFLECRRFRDAHRKRAARYAPAPRSPIDRDPEVAAFLAERFGRVTVEAILLECRERFGEDRTPARSSAYLYWKRLRDGELSR